MVHIEVFINIDVQLDMSKCNICTMFGFQSMPFKHLLFPNINGFISSLNVCPHEFSVFSSFTQLVVIYANVISSPQVCSLLEFRNKSVKSIIMIITKLIHPYKWSCFYTSAKLRFRGV